MRYYAYFPGCTLKAGSIGYEQSTKAVSKALGLELIELEDWNCCGATAYSSIAEVTAFCMSGRNLALAEKTGLNLVAPCSACYTVLKKTDSYLKEYPKLKSQVSQALAAGGLTYQGGVRVRHFAEVLVNDVGSEAIRVKQQKSLEGLKVAIYYGCQMLRPMLDFDHPEFPRSLDGLVKSLGAEPVYFPLKARCCGGSQILSRENLALELIQKLLFCAADNGAQCIVTVCPLCQTNLDAYQSRINQRFKTDYHLPVLFLPQLIGVALGIEPQSLGLKTNIVSSRKVLAPYL
jgi:heterodisulfide reductase subunit B